LTHGNCTERPQRQGDCQNGPDYFPRENLGGAKKSNGKRKVGSETTIEKRPTLKRRREGEREVTRGGLCAHYGEGKGGG